MDLRNINPPAGPGELHHDDEAVLGAALWLRRHRNTVDLAVVRDLKTRLDLTPAKAVEAIRLCNGGGYG